MFRDLWKWLRAEGMNPGAPGEEDPDALLSRAQQEMNELHARNREQAMRAITAKNSLQQMVDDIQKKITVLETQAHMAEQSGNPAEAERLRRQIEQCSQSLESTRISLAQATQTAEQVKEAIRREEEVIRRKTAEALALRAEWQALEAYRGLRETLRELSENAHGAAAGQQQRTMTPDEQRARYQRHREAVLRAVVEKNNLQQMLGELQRKVENLHQKAEFARNRGDNEMEYALLREAEQYEAAIASRQDLMSRAERITEQAKRFIQQEEARIHLLDSVAEDAQKLSAATESARIPREWEWPDGEDAPDVVDEDYPEPFPVWLAVIALALMIILLLLLLR